MAGSMTQQLADALKVGQLAVAKLRQAVVTAVSEADQRMSVALGGNEADIQSVPYLEGMQPHVDDTVWIVEQGPMLLGLGSQKPGGTPAGTITMWGGAAGSAPTGWLPCDGAAVSRTTYASLFAVCSTRFGSGNGSTTFNVPNMSRKFPIGPSGGYSPGATGGTWNHGHYGGLTAYDTGGTTIRQPNSDYYSTAHSHDQYSWETDANPPYLVVEFIIKY